MANAFPIDAAQITALFLESVFFGIYLVTFGIVMNALLTKRLDRGFTKQLYIFLAVALALFVLATLDEAILVRHVLEAFIWHSSGGSAVANFSDAAYWESVIKMVTYSTQTSIADAVLIYRCYIVYNRNWMIALCLGIMWAAGVAMETYNVLVETRSHSRDGLASNDALRPWMTSVLIISLTLNIIATSLIVAKIYRCQKDNDAFRLSNHYSNKNENSLKRAMITIIESAAMYTLSVAILLAVYLANNNAMYGVSDVVVQIIGISFNLIIIRVSQGQSVETSVASSMSFACSARNISLGHRSRGWQQHSESSRSHSADRQGLRGELTRVNSTP